MKPTYSFSGVSMAFSHPYVGDYAFSGKQGKGQITISMATEKTVMDVAADGGVMPSYIMGDNGTFTIELQQTSDFHAWLLKYYNKIKVNADAGNPRNWAAASCSVRSLVDGAWHSMTGVAPVKLSDKVYASQGQKVTWQFAAADIQSGVN